MKFQLRFDIFQIEYTKIFEKKGIGKMEIQQLYYYMELCKQKNFTEAGYACNMTQGALSKQIRKLENELGITLIRRNTRKFELSKEGEIFLSYAKKMTGTYEEMLKKCSKKSGN